MTPTTTPDRCPRCGAARSVASPARCDHCGYRYRSVSSAIARRDRLARWDPWLGLGFPVSLGAVLAAVGVSGDDMILTWIGVGVALVGAPIGWVIGHRSRRRTHRSSG